MVARFWLKNIYRWKDIGIIIERLNRDFDCDTYILAMKGEENYIGRSSKILELKNKSFDVAKYIWDIKPGLLILFHFTRWTLVYTILSKIINPVWKIYIKADTYLSTTNNHFYNKDTISRKFLALMKVLLFFAEVSLENKKDCQRLKDLWYKVHHIPNWIDMSDAYENQIKKEDLIITVWRLGSVQKNNQDFLRIAKQVLESKKGYKAILVGSIEDETNFSEYLKNFLQKNEDIKDRIIITWLLPQKEVFELYKKARFLIMTSLWEWFSNVFAEAAYFGTIIISTDVWGAEDITNNWEFWYIYKDIDDVLPFIEHQNIDTQALKKYILKFYNRDVIIKKLYHEVLQ